ncbi:MAG TPA: hypothetical protein DCZ01_09725 [Elusimicrobia bacterium]|nr:hypothetical protein [Elusimicrobiota bacterium]
MATSHFEASEVPTFKLAKVGKDRDRKRGAAWFGARAAGPSALRGAFGGAGAGTGAVGAGASLAKTLLTLALVGGLSAGAWQIGSMMRGAKPGAKADKKLFAGRGDQKYDDLSGVIKNDKSIPNSLGYISGSMDGLTAEERAKKAAEAEAARAAEEAARKKAEEEADKPPSAAAAAAADPRASAGAGMPRAFGKLSSSFASSPVLVGGAGLSGGINRSFADASGPNKAQGGALSSYRSGSKPTYSQAARATAGKSKSKGFAKRQLANAFSLSRQAASAGKAESQADLAAAPFDNNAGAGGNVISGPGVGQGVSQGASDTSSQSSDSGSSGGTTACGSDQYADSNGDCQSTDTGSTTNAATYQWMIDAVTALLVVLAVLFALIMILRGGEGTVVLTPIVQIAIIAVGGLIAALGAAIIATSGDIMIGGISAAVGAAAAIYGAINPGVSIPMLIAISAGGVIASAGAALAAANSKASQLD